MRALRNVTVTEHLLLAPLYGTRTGPSTATIGTRPVLSSRSASSTTQQTPLEPGLPAISTGQPVSMRYQDRNSTGTSR